MRLDGQLYYANALTYRDQVKSMIAEMASPPRAVILDSSAWYQIDVTSSDILIGLVKELKGKGIELFLADVHMPVLEQARKTGLLESVGEDHVFPTIALVVLYIEGRE